MGPNFLEPKSGSKPLSTSLSDGISTIRDSILLVLAEIVSIVGDRFLGEEFTPELQGAVVVIAFAVLKFGWKFFTDTRRVASL